MSVQASDEVAQRLSEVIYRSGLADVLREASVTKHAVINTDLWHRAPTLDADLRAAADLCVFKHLQRVEACFQLAITMWRRLLSAAAERRHGEHRAEQGRAATRQHIWVVPLRVAVCEGHVDGGRMEACLHFDCSYSAGQWRA